MNGQEQKTINISSAETEESTTEDVKVVEKDRYENSYRLLNSTAHVHMTKASSDDFNVMT